MTSASVVLAYRPAGIDGPTWSLIRREWIATSAEPKRTMVLRTQLAERHGMRFEALRRWAKRCGWPGCQKHNGRLR